MKNNLVYSRTSVYNINYHVVGAVKYRKKILTPQIESQMQSIALDIDNPVHLFEVVEKDHVHCFISAPTKISVSYIVKMLKSILVRKIFILYPELKQYLSSIGINANYIYLKTNKFSDINIKELQIKFIDKDTFAAIAVYEIKDTVLMADNNNYLSIDLGLKNNFTCYDSNDVSTTIKACTCIV